MAGTNKTLKGDIVTPDQSGVIAAYWTGGDKTGEEISAQEVWFYSAREAA